MFEKLRSILNHEGEKSNIERRFTKNIPERTKVVPLFARPKRLGSISEKLHFSLCEHCRKTPMLVAVKGKLCLLSCENRNCSRIFRIDTSVA